MLKQHNNNNCGIETVEFLGTPYDRMKRRLYFARKSHSGYQKGLFRFSGCPQMITINKK